MQIRSNQTMKYAIVIILFVLQYQFMFAQTNVDSLETIYLKFQIPVKSKNKDVNAWQAFIHVGYIKVENNKNSILFHRRHRTLGHTRDQFIFDKKMFRPKRISQKELSMISFSNFDILEKRAQKEGFYASPWKIFPNITIVTVDKNKGVYLYEHVVWQREVTSDD